MESAKAIDGGAAAEAMTGDGTPDRTGDARSAAPGAPRALAYPRLFGAIVGGVFVADQITKLLAVDMLSPAYFPRRVVGDALRLTLVYNPGAAFGLHLGAQSRWIFMALTVGALVLLGRLYVETTRGDLRRVTAIALVCGGALGNLLDRVRSARGVVDFIDVGVGTARWPTFNVADMAVSCGAILLAYVLWREDVDRQRAAPAASGASAGASADPADDLPGGSDARDPSLPG
ncbi:MAG TPA: signal peptidase II [Gemmatimonadaceae bacterium]|nr:signal peptidase II [Gemmatimonadaceae bacterium]